MTIIDVAGLLQPCSAAAPCGDNLEYERGFLDFEAAIRGKPEQQIGDTIVAAEPPDWAAIGRQALDLAGRTKDLRVALPLLRAQIVGDGLAGLAAGLALIEGYVTSFWDGLYPSLDADDGNDPAARLNTLAELCDQTGLLRDLRHIPLARSAQLGQVAFRDYALAAHLMEPLPGSAPPDPALVDATFRDSDPAFLAGNSRLIGEALGRLDAIETALADTAGAGAIDLAPLRRLLADMKALIDRHGPAAEDAPQAGAAAEGQAVAEGSGAIRSHGDVAATLDRICRWYAQNEPASPIPLLLNRIKRLVSKDFLSLLADLAPDGTSQFRFLAGLGDERD
jgi:type VI secretion system protein ImpA